MKNENYLATERHIGYEFKNRSFLEQALTHKSFHNENPEISIGDNERLEFLGDSVLDLILSEMLMQMFPEADEGTLSKQRAVLVSEVGLVELANELELAKVLTLGRGERRNGGAAKPRLLASVVEAVIGAVYLDADFPICKQVVRKLFCNRLNGDAEALESFDAKSHLQAMVQEKMKLVPVYCVDNAHGPDHRKVFEVSVWIDQKKIASGSGKSKKTAEQAAAKKAVEQWVVQQTSTGEKNRD